MQKVLFHSFESFTYTHRSLFFGRPGDQARTSVSPGKICQVFDDVMGDVYLELSLRIPF